MTTHSVSPEGLNKLSTVPRPALTGQQGPAQHSQPQPPEKPLSTVPGPHHKQTLLKQAHHSPWTRALCPNLPPLPKSYFISVGAHLQRLK